MLYEKKKTLAQVFSCEFCEIFKNTFFIEHYRVGAFETLCAPCDYLHFSLLLSFELIFPLSLARRGLLFSHHFLLTTVFFLDVIKIVFVFFSLVNGLTLTFLLAQRNVASHFLSGSKKEYEVSSRTYLFF